MRKTLILTALMVLIMLLPAKKTEAATNSTFCNNGNGTVTVTYETKKDTVMLVLVENTKTDNKAVKYFYKLSEGTNEMVVPLSEGSGTYKVRICKMLPNNKASITKTWTTFNEKAGATEVFENPNVIVNYDIAPKAVEKAAELTKNCKTETDKVKTIWDYVVKNYGYDNELLNAKVSTEYYVPSIAETYRRQLGICFDISSLVAGMLRSIDVDARIITGYTPNVAVYHAWNQVYDSKEKEWYTLDCTYDLCKYADGVKVKMIKKDSEYENIVYKY